MSTQEDSTRIIEQLSDKILQQEHQIAELNAKLRWYEEQFRLSRQKKFGASSEKTDTEQLSLFNEVEDTANPQAKEATLETITYQRRKSRPGRNRNA
jgi:uncharacterized coiled-coil protein SlyX